MTQQTELYEIMAKWLSFEYPQKILWNLKKE